MRSARQLLRPEARLLLATRAHRSPVGSNPAPRVESLDLQRLLAYAARERAVLPLWRSIGNSMIAADLERGAALKGMAQVWEFQLLTLERLLQDITKALHDAGVDVVLLKGAAAALSVYGGFTRRPMVDIDLLVGEGQGETAWTVAREAGWRWDADLYPREAYADAHHLPPLSDPRRSGVGLEIHTRLSSPGTPFRLVEEELRKNAREVDLGGVRCRIPLAHHQLLHSCIHFAWSHRMYSHGWRTFSDVGAFVDSGQVDWVDFVRLARQTRAETCCYWTLRMAAEVARVPLPAGLLDELRPSGPRVLLDLLERHYVMNLIPDEQSSPSIRFARLMWRMGIQRGEGSSGIHLPGHAAPMRLPARLAHHSRKVPVWLRYLRRLA